MSALLREHARSIWQAAVEAARPHDALRAALSQTASSLADELHRARRILVVGGGKAGASMAVAVEELLPGCRDRLEGVVNVPAPAACRPFKIRLHEARPAGTNQPTAAGVTGSEEILRLIGTAGPRDIALCLLSGGGSALLPAPVEGVTLDDKQEVTRLLHACGATINEMNCVRKHLSRIKGGGLARAFTGKAMFSLIISDVIGDPLDVIASGPTAADPTTFDDAKAVLTRYRLADRIPAAVRTHLQRGSAGGAPDTLKTLPSHVANFIIANNALSLAASAAKAEALGYRVLNLGSCIEGETRHVATAMAGIVRSIRAQGTPFPPPLCLLSGGETTVTLAENHGRGGRNQEFALAAAIKLGAEGLRNVALLCGGTDGEDGPTDAAGAVVDETTPAKAASAGMDPASYLARNDAFDFFRATGDLLVTGLTQTNVMDVRVILIA